MADCATMPLEFRKESGMVSQPSRAAVVVVHGIGEQPPVSTLGRFAQGMIDHAGASQPEAVLRRVGEMSVPVLRFSETSDSTASFTETDVMEFSWQHLVRGHTSAFPTLAWLVSTTLAPLDFARHWRILAMAGPEAPSPWAVVLRQLLIAVILLIPLLLLLTLLLYVASALSGISVLPRMPPGVGGPLSALLLF